MRSRPQRQTPDQGLSCKWRMLENKGITSVSRETQIILRCCAFERGSIELHQPVSYHPSLFSLLGAYVKKGEGGDISASSKVE